MAGGRIPVPFGIGSNTLEIDAGTLARSANQPPVPICQAESDLSKRAKAQALVEKYKENEQNNLTYSIAGQILIESGVGGNYVSKVRQAVNALYPPEERSSKEALDLFNKIVSFIQTAEKLLGKQGKLIVQAGASALGLEFYAKATLLSMKNYFIAKEIIQLDPYVASYNHIEGAEPFHSSFGGAGAGGKW